jgi:hypothetical protein
VGVGRLEPEAVAQEGGEGPRDRAAGEGPGVLGVRGALRADHDAGAAPDPGHRLVEEAEVVVVDVEVHDHVALGIQQSAAQCQPVVGRGVLEGLDLRVLASEALGEGGGRIGRPVLDHEDLEGGAAGAEPLAHLGHGGREDLLLVVGGQHHGDLRAVARGEGRHAARTVPPEREGNG